MPEKRLIPATSSKARVFFFIFSSKSLYAISLKDGKNTLFYIDEQFVHVHPEIEKTIISVIIDLIGKESQVFFTTHNLEILDMNLPIHSFVFLHRDKYITEVIYPEKILVNKNDRGLKNLAENNLFNTIPDVSLLETISEE